MHFFTKKRRRPSKTCSGGLRNGSLFLSAAFMPHTGAQDQSRSEHFLQNGVAPSKHRIAVCLTGLWFMPSTACDSIDDVLIVVIASSQTGILSSLNAVDNGHGSIVAQRSEAVGVLHRTQPCRRSQSRGWIPLRSLRRSRHPSAGRQLRSLPDHPSRRRPGRNCQTDALSLSQDLTDFLIVVGAEHHFGSLAQNGGQLVL